MAGVPSIPLGIGAPNYIGFTINSGDSDLDLTTVTALNLIVTVALTGASLVWACTIVTKTATQLTAIYPFNSDGLDVVSLGTYELAPEMVVPGGVVPGYAIRFQGTNPGQTSYRNP